MNTDRRAAAAPHLASRFKTTAIAAKEESRTALVLQVERCTDPDFNHKKNVDHIVPSIVNQLEIAGVGFAPEFSFFTPSYVYSESAFVVVMPTSCLHRLWSLP